VEKYSQIIASGNSQQMLAYLKTLDDNARRALVPLIKKEARRLHEFYEIKPGRWGQRGSAQQFEMLIVAMLSCYSRADSRSIKAQYFYAVKPEILDAVLSWSSPEWFTALMQKYADQNLTPVDYEILCDWLAKGYVHTVAPDYIARQIINAPSCVEKYPFILDSHIWTIFSCPCNISLLDYWREGEGFAEDSETGRWTFLFQKYTQNQRLDRQRVLKECLLGVNRQFKKDQTNWFATLFTALQPIDEECLQHQDELFAALSCPQSKPVNTALQAIKRIVGHSAFRDNEFISHLPLLFSATTKSIIESSLLLADKLATLTPERRADICQHLTGVFLNKAPALQNKAAKLLVKYGDKADPQLRALLTGYEDNLLSGARTLLVEFLAPSTAQRETQDLPVIALPIVREDNRLPEIECWDDFIFLAGRAFLNLESYHFDQFPAALVRFAAEINHDNVVQLEPAFAQAWKIVRSSSTAQGTFDRILASFFLQFAGQLTRRFDNKSIAAVYARYQALTHSDDKYEKLTWGFHEWQKSTRADFQPYIDILTAVLHRLEKAHYQPLLSTPSHLPCFIAPDILLERLNHYQQTGNTQCEVDFQLALQRCVIEGEIAGLESLNGEYAAVMRYFLSGKLSVPVNDTVLAAMITRRAILPAESSYAPGQALLIERNLPPELLTPHFPWRLVAPVTSGKGDKQTEKLLRFDVTRHVRKTDARLFYLYSLNTSYSRHSADQQRILFSFPWYSEGVLMHFIENLFERAGIREDACVINMLQAVNALPQPLTPMGHMLIAFCFLHASATVRTLAADIWQDRLGRGEPLDSVSIGETLGILEAQGWAPLKRFTDLAMELMRGISARHDCALLEMVAVIDTYLQPVNITNYKKLTELRYELTRQA